MIRNSKFKIRPNLLGRLLFTNRCRVCEKVIELGETFCESCSVEKLRVPEKTLENQTLSNKNFDLYTAPFYYDADVRKCIHNFKYDGFKNASEFLADEMIKVLERDFKTQNPDIVTCVPMTKKRKRQKGYNQCEILTKYISKAFSLKSLPNLIVKIKDTPTQVNLNYEERIKNLKGAFKVNEKYDIKGKTILLCDDVRTTSSTLDECSKALKRAGASRVICVTCAINSKNI